MSTSGTCPEPTLTPEMIRREAVANDVSNPPTLTSLTPNTVEIGGPDVTLILEGTEFNQYTTVVWNGSDERTTFIDAEHVGTYVKPSMTTVAVTLPVTVRNGEMVADPPLDFTFTEAS